MYNTALELFFFFECEEGPTLELLAQRVRGVSILGGTPNLTGHGLEQPVAADPALSKGQSRWSPEAPSASGIL